MMKNYFWMYTTAFIITQSALWNNRSVNGFTFVPQRTTSPNGAIGNAFTQSNIGTLWSNPHSVVELQAKKSKDKTKTLVDDDSKTLTIDGAVEETKNDNENLDIDSLVDEAVDAADKDGASKSEEAEVEVVAEVEEDAQSKLDKEMMKLAIQMARSSGGERGSHSPFPKPVVGAVLATSTGEVLSSGRSNYEEDAVEAVVRKAGIKAIPLSEWCVSWSSDSKLRSNLKDSTLYITLEPSARRKGLAFPPITQLIQMSGITRCVIGCPSPIEEYATEGASALHAAGLEVTMGVEVDECKSLISRYSELANSKLQKIARKHYELKGRPLGFLHCSVVDSDDAQAFANNGNAFAKKFGGQSLSSRDFGSYELAPPPEAIWAGNNEKEDDIFTETDDFFGLDFDDEDEQEMLGSNPMMPWYEQVDAVVATFPRPGNGPADDQSVTARLNGLKWLATNGNLLPANVERILVMDATDLSELPLSNDDPNLPSGVDVEAFWKADGRRPTRVLLRSGDNAQAIAAAKAAAQAAADAAEAAQRAKDAIESGDAELAAEAAIRCQEAAFSATSILQKEMQSSQDLKQKLVALGAKVEVMKGKEPIDVMNHLGAKHGYHSVVWRAGCWGSRGVKAIVTGAFQWISAHLAVDAVGGRFWQLMLAERAIQGACGSESRVKVFAEQDDINLEYCDDEDSDCELTVNGKPIRHIRLDCRALVEDPDRVHEYVLTKTTPFTKEKLAETAPWFL